MNELKQTTHAQIDTRISPAWITSRLPVIRQLAHALSSVNSTDKRDNAIDGNMCPYRYDRLSGLSSGTIETE